ncbi:sensor histidine kinase [Streptomyces triticagri]|uniref:histidine kinase n=1 Tax=Streptomyces triticagri TaxID=2293568 RepID=A0A372LZ49_9ACTN|nr:HAMP domain-containing sensor histidine kinase [Streptomyces triticagri]RFU83942.1 sensor histidine kinase [Streptomyces triticagri]
MSGHRARRRRRAPLRRRLTLAASAAVAVVAVALCAGAYAIVHWELERQLRLQLTQSVARLGVDRDEPAEYGTLSGECRYLAAPACAQLVPADPDRDRGDHLLPVTDEVREAAAGRQGPFYSTGTVDGHPLLVLTQNHGTDRAVQVALRSDGVDRSERRAAWLFAGLGGGAVLLAAGLGYWVARTGLAPVARLTATAERITSTRDAGHRIELPEGRGEDEITRLAASFNGMLEALEDSVEARRRLVADASHELRTPLTSLSANAELLGRSERLSPAQRDRACAAVVRQARGMTGLVNDLIELARGEQPPTQAEAVDAVALVRSAVESARGHWPSVVFRVAVHKSPRLVHGDPARLDRLLTNLLDNAAKFSPPGGPVEVALTAEAEHLILTVRDHGPGIAPEDQPYVFDRFYRSRSARALPGSGLGLAMAQQTARAHGGRLTAGDAGEGGGAELRLRLPYLPAGPERGQSRIPT